ncbi:hypothetical protein ACFSHP_12980 [Novosphingobium panipatense]
MLRSLGEADWFNLGDRDLGTHIARSWRLRQGDSLSQITARLTRALGIAHAIVPMSDAPVRTQVGTAGGWLDFQRYFVKEQCRPVATGSVSAAHYGLRRHRPLPPRSRARTSARS